MADVASLGELLEVVQSGSELAPDEWGRRFRELQPGSGRVARLLHAAEQPPGPRLAAAIEQELEQLGRLRTLLLAANDEMYSRLQRLYDETLEAALWNRAIRIKIGSVVAAGRQNLGITLAELGRRIGGVSGSYISQIERGKALPSERRAELLDREMRLGDRLPGLDGGTTLVQLLADLREREAEIAEQNAVLAQRRRGAPNRALESSLRAVRDQVNLVGDALRRGPRHPSPVTEALELWNGPQRATDIEAIERAAGQPLLREAINLLADLPAELQTNAIGTLRSLRDLALSARVGTNEAGPRVLFDPKALWRRQREATPIVNWELPSLLLELLELFAPPTERPLGEPSELYRQLRAALDERNFDAEAIVRGPILRRAASAVVDSWRVTRNAEQPGTPGWQDATPLANWFQRRSGEKVVGSLRRILWSYWASLEPAGALQHPAPPDDYTGGPPPQVPPHVEWFFDRATTNSLDGWQFSSLDEEWRIQSNQEQTPTPWAQALTLWEVDRTELERELYRRRRRLARREADIPRSERATRLLGEGFLAFEEGRKREAGRIFASVAESFPEVPGAQNNLGYFFLDEGRYDEALERFKKAEELKFDDRHILRVNTGTALYMLGIRENEPGRFEAALERFRSAFQQPPVSAGAILLAIDDTEPFQVSIASVMDYVALAALGAAWSAFRLDRYALAHQFLQVVRTQEVTFEPPDKERFDAAIRDLEEQLDEHVHKS